MLYLCSGSLHTSRHAEVAHEFRKLCCAWLQLRPGGFAEQSNLHWIGIGKIQFRAPEDTCCPEVQLKISVVFFEVEQLRQGAAGWQRLCAGIGVRMLRQ